MAEQEEINNELRQICADLDQRIESLQNAPNAVPSTIDRRDEIAHETALKELHNVDGLVETHSRMILVISAALLAFSLSTVTNREMVPYIAIFGILIALEWILKIVRHRDIFLHCLERIRTIETKIGIDAIRPPPKERIISFDGFTLLLVLAGIILIFWSTLVGLHYTDIGMQHPKPAVEHSKKQQQKQLDDLRPEEVATPNPAPEN